MELRSYLEQLNLSSKEIAVYLACLELGQGPVVPIAHKACLPRTTVVYILEQLRERGLVEILPKGSRHLYLPLPPRSVATLLRRKKEKLEEQIESLEAALPELNKLYSLTPFQPSVRYYQGRQEFQQIYDEMLRSRVEAIRWVGEVSMIEEILGAQYLKRWIKRRSELGIRTQAIRIRGGEVNEPEYVQVKEYQRSLRFAPADFSSPAHILLYADTVVIMTSAKEGIGLAVTSRDYALTMQNWFEELWKVSSEE